VNQIVRELFVDSERWRRWFRALTLSAGAVCTGLSVQAPEAKRWPLFAAGTILTAIGGLTSVGERNEPK
jgi:hypothetical protein